MSETATITRAAREAERERIRTQAVERAMRDIVTLTCQHPDVRAHDTCTGLRAAGRFGCLCVCHDEDAA